ncbi:MAG: formate dehydrogenase accessory sulfurtransferase FdhD [Eubacteriales bacterium]
MEEYKKYRIQKNIKGLDVSVDDFVVVEYSMSIYINDHYFVTLLCTPKSLEALVIGYLQSEGIIEQIEDIRNIQIRPEIGKAWVYLKTQDIFDFKGDQLVLERVITTACGKGRTVSFPMVDKKIRINSPLSIDNDKVIRLMQMFSKQSNLFQRTGGVHSCALCTYNQLAYFEEDIGRHNALEKVLGRGLMNHEDFLDKIILTTGRMTSEIINKVALRGISMVVSRSAPTDQAIDMARRMNMILIGFVRGTRMNIYTRNKIIKKD